MLQAIRYLVERVMVSRTASHPGRITVEIAGRLNAPLGEQALAPQGSASVGKVGSERGLHTRPHPFGAILFKDLSGGVMSFVLRETIIASF
jgi:hypothetical protein